MFIMDNLDNCSEEKILTEFKNRFSQKAGLILSNIDYATIDMMIGATIMLITDTPILIEFSTKNLTYRDLFESIQRYLVQAADHVDRSEYFDKMKVRGETYHIYTLNCDLVVAESNNLAILCFGEAHYDLKKLRKD